MIVFGNPLEQWTKDEVKPFLSLKPEIPADWLNGWTPQPATFSKLADYWDTDSYDDDTQGYLGHAVSPPDSWGLAERSNYQFLSYSTIFKQEDSQTKYGFSHPAYANTTEHRSV